MDPYHIFRSLLFSINVDGTLYIRHAKFYHSRKDEKKMFRTVTQFVHKVPFIISWIKRNVRFTFTIWMVCISESVFLIVVCCGLAIFFCHLIKKKFLGSKNFHVYLVVFDPFFSFYCIIVCIIYYWQCEKSYVLS